MFAVLKCFLGLFAIVCFMQFVEMARLRRDDDAPAPAGTGGDINLNDIPELFTSMVTKIKTALGDDAVKNLLNTASTALSDGSEALKKQLADITSSSGVGGH